MFVTLRRLGRLTEWEIKMADSDAGLARSAARGDKTALETLYRRHVDRVWRYAYLRTNSRDAAGEVVQETFLRVVRSIRSFKAHSGFATWLFALTRSAAIDLVRRERTDRARDLGPTVLKLRAAESAPKAGSPNDEVRAVVREAVGGLPGAQRDVIVLCELSGFTMREAAATLGWGESRVKVTLFRARRKLRERLRAYVGEEVADRSGDRR